MRLCQFITLIVTLVWLSTSQGEEFTYQKPVTDLKQSLTSSEQAWLNKKPTLTYVYDPDWQPFEYKNSDGIHTGIIADLLNIISKKTDITFQPIETATWSDSVQTVKDGKADMFSAITVTKERQTYLNFTSQDIFSYPAALVTKFEDKTVYLDFKEDCHSKKIGIVRGSGLGEYIQASHPNFNYVVVNSTYEGFKLLESGEIDNFAINTVTAKYFIKNRGFDNLKIALILNYRYHLKIAVSHDLPTEIISILNKTLSTIDEKTLDDLLIKWTQVKEPKETDWDIIINILAVTLTITLFFIWNTRRLNTLVKERTNKLSKVVKKLDELATIDPLTEIANRRKYEERLQIEIDDRKRSCGHLSLLVLDVDNFKNYNDRYGHDNGDLILKKIATVIKNSLPRKTDCVARYGGEEFVVILPLTDSSGAQSLAESIRLAIESIDYQTIEGLKHERITVSIGVATLSEESPEETNLFKLADTALYQAKNSGKNTICVYRE